MAHVNGSPDTLENHQHEVCGAFARAAVAMRDAAQTAENFSNWFSRVNNLQNVPVPPMFNGSYNFISQFTGQQQHSSSAEVTGKKRKVPDDEDDDGKKKRSPKEKRKPHDPNAPKRPPSAYLLFQNEVRKDVKAQHPDMPYSQVLSEISKLWHALTPEEKGPYMQATADSKVMYKEAKATYDALSPTEAKDSKEVKVPSAKPSTSKSKTPAVSSVVVPKPTPKDATTSSGEDEDDTSPSSDNSSGAGDSVEEDEEDEIVEEAPEPPRKKSKKETVREPSPPSVKVIEKMKKKEGKEGKEKKKK